MVRSRLILDDEFLGKSRQIIGKAERDDNKAREPTHQLELAPDQPADFHLPGTIKARHSDRETSLLSDPSTPLVAEPSLPSSLVDVADEHGDLSRLLVHYLDSVELETDVEPLSFSEQARDALEDIVLRDEEGCPRVRGEPPALEIGGRENEDLLRARSQGDGDGRVIGRRVLS